MCLYEEAHGVDASHPIFQGPFPVTLTLHDMATPAHYRRHPDGQQLGDTMPAWNVVRGKAGRYVGVVADGYGFEDSPDAEWIASGRNSKNARAAALARQGNFFHWGFAASPPEMTDEAQTVFLNTMVYMRRFAGQRPLAVGKGRSREWLSVYLASPDGLSDYTKKEMPAAWREAAGDDLSKLRQLCAAELGFVHQVDGHWQVDADCKALGLDNRLAASLRACAELLRDDTLRAAASRVLERYTGQHFAGADDWQHWLTDAGERLFHSDVIGHFAVAPADCAAPHRARSD
ncbi:MAG TPA: hypothetical protein VFZ65_07865 [Planctomycetota bacterium]|nr:hypothetical protein [Planctomycetota bacterium]